VIGFGFGLIFVVPLALLVGAWILRGAISMANNRLAPPPSPPQVSHDEDDWGDYPIKGVAEPSTAAIPIPGIFSAMWMVVVVVFVNLVVRGAIWAATGWDSRARRHRDFIDDPEEVVRFLTWPLIFLITSGLLAALLPTTFRRGLLVSLFIVLICLPIAALFLVPILFLGCR